MNRSRAVILAAAMAALPFSATAEDAFLLVEEPKAPFTGSFSVETKGHRLFADVGDSGATFDVSAMLTVLVTRSGRPVPDLGDSIPPNGGPIALPPAFTLRSSHASPPGPVGIGCAFTPTGFTNQGEGVYTIRVVPLLGTPACRWGLGDYHYTVGVAVGGVRGRALGVLTIPDSPSVP